MGRARKRQEPVGDAEERALGASGRADAERGARGAAWESERPSRPMIGEQDLDPGEVDEIGGSSEEWGEGRERRI